ncbi:hypothetical protein CP8484711_0876B, partial [Chlamydia psittaci 84-8471/1]
FAEIIRWYS